MREDFKTQRLGAVLHQLISDWGLEKKLDEARALEMWHELAGDRINRRTRNAWIKHGRLHVAISSSVWRHQLTLQRSLWLERLNKALGKEIISEIIFK